MSRLLIAAALGALLGGCGELAKAEGEACAHSGDCIWPAVCCAEATLQPLDAPPLFCEDARSCKSALPPLIEGNPCRRTAGTISECRAPWACCETTLTCLTPEACAAAPAPEPVMSSGDRCHADSDCGPGEICDGINLAARDGQCRALVEAEASPPG